MQLEQTRFDDTVHRTASNEPLSQVGVHAVHMRLLEVVHGVDSKVEFLMHDAAQVLHARSDVNVQPLA